MRWRRRTAATPHDGWTTEVSSGLALAGFLFLVFVGFTLLAMGPLISIDTYFNLDPPPPGWVGFLHVLDRIGQRAVCLPILAVATLVSCRYRESWRPAVVVAASVFSLNLFVLILKVLLGRGQPEVAEPSFFVGGMAYPSGHTANIVLVYGLVAYLLSRYRNVSRVLVRVLWSAVALLSLTMVITSLTLNWHWFADLIAGLLVGGVTLQLTVAVDSAVPQDALVGAPHRVMSRIRRRGNLRRPGSPREPRRRNHPALRASRRTHPPSPQPPRCGRWPPPRNRLSDPPLDRRPPTRALRRLLGPGLRCGMPSPARARGAVVAVLLVLAVRALGVVVLAVAAGADGRSAHARLVRWDAQWYAGIARSGYGHTVLHPDGRHLSDYAFFPLLPALERGVAAVTGLAYVDAGLVVSWVATALAAWGVYAVAERVHDVRVGIVLAVLWAALPIGIVTSMAYSEAVFTALAAWALHATLRERWLLAGVLAAAAGLTRPVGVAVVAAVVVAAALHVVRTRDLRPLAGLVVAPLGWLGYVAWVGARTGEPLGYFRVADGWGNGVDGGRAFAAWVGDHLTAATWPQGLLLVVAVAAVLGLFVLSVRDRQPLPLLVFTGVLLALALTTSGYFGSKPRYLLPAFPLLLPVAVRLSRVRTRAVVSVLGVLTAGSAAYGAIWLLGPGPP